MCCFTLLFCGFAVYFLSHSYTRFLTVCACISFFQREFLPDPNIRKNNQSRFNMISTLDDCLMHVHLGNVYQTHRLH